MGACRPGAALRLRHAGLLLRHPRRGLVHRRDRRGHSHAAVPPRLARRPPRGAGRPPGGLRRHHSHAPRVLRHLLPLRSAQPGRAAGLAQASRSRSLAARGAPPPAVRTGDRRRGHPDGVHELRPLRQRGRIRPLAPLRKPRQRPGSPVRAGSTTRSWSATSTTHSPGCPRSASTRCGSASTGKG
jgi:hypothetical protein